MSNSMIKSAGSVLVFAFTLALSGAAFARQAPAIVLEKAAAENSLRLSESARNFVPGGYRDSLLRYARDERVSRAAAPGGYRDMLSRFEFRDSKLVVRRGLMDIARR